MFKKFNVLKNNKLIQVAINDYNDCRIKFSFLNNLKPLSREQTGKIMDILIGQFIEMNGFQIVCKSRNDSYGKIKEATI